MPKVFNAGDYNITPVKPIISPAKNAVVARMNLLKNLASGLKFGDSHSFIKEIIALNLAELGVNDFVFFNPLKTEKNSSREGVFFDASNTISIAENYVYNTANLGRGIDVAAHETYHKYQSFIGKDAKYFTEKEHLMSPNNVKFFAKLVGFSPKTAINFYHICKAEKGAFTYGDKFASEFLSQALDLAKQSGDEKTIAELTKQLEIVSKTGETILNTIATKEQAFISHNLGNMYEKSSTTFDNILSLVYAFNSRAHLNEKQQETLQHLRDLSDEMPRDGDYPNAITALGVILGYFPERSRVENYLDFAIASNDRGVFQDAIHHAFINAVPLTKTDVTRLILTTDYHRGPKDCGKVFSPETLAAIDDTFWVQNMLLAQGPEITTSIVNQMKGLNLYHNVDFKLVEGIIEEYPREPLIVVDGKEIYGCGEVLDFAVSNLIASGRIPNNPISFAKTREELSKNLTNIVNHFDNPNPENSKFISSIERFCYNPYEKQFEDKKEEFSEVSRILSPEPAEKLSEYIGEVRSQGVEQKPKEVEYTPINEDGEDYGQLLVKSLEKLAQSLKELAEVLSRPETVSMIRKLGIQGINSKNLEVKESVYNSSKNEKSSSEEQGDNGAECNSQEILGKENIEEIVGEVEPVSEVDFANEIDSKVQSDKIQTEEVNVQEGTDLKLEATTENTSLIAPIVPPEA